MKYPNSGLGAFLDISAYLINAICLFVCFVVVVIYHLLIVLTHLLLSIFHKHSFLVVRFITLILLLTRIVSLYI